MNGRILIVDDTPVIREFLEEFFSDSGYDVDTAEDGHIGLDMALKEDYSLILCDVHMPEMNGMDMVINLRQSKAETPIIMMDSLPGKQAKQANEAGAQGCLAKPFDLDELRAIVKRLIKLEKITAR